MIEDIGGVLHILFPLFFALAFAEIVAVISIVLLSLAFSVVVQVLVTVSRISLSPAFAVVVVVFIIPLTCPFSLLSLSLALDLMGWTKHWTYSALIPTRSWRIWESYWGRVHWSGCGCRWTSCQWTFGSWGC